MTSEISITKDSELGLWKCDLEIQLPKITVTRYKKDKTTSNTRCVGLSLKLLRRSLRRRSKR